MDLGLDGQGALYEQLARALKRAILEGRFAAGSHLPATRQLARMLGVSRNSVLSAYELLCAEQLAIVRGGSGTRVADVGAPRTRTARAASAPPSRYAARARRLGPVTLGVTPARPRYNLQYGVPLLNPRLFNSWRTKLAAAAVYRSRLPAGCGTAGIAGRQLRQPGTAAPTLGPWRPARSCHPGL